MEEKELKDNPRETEDISEQAEESQEGTAPDEQSAVPSPDELASRISSYEKELEDMKNKYLRALADLDNYKKRVEREKAELFNYGLFRFIKELLPVLDSLEKAVNSYENNEKGNEAIIQGITLVMKKFHTTLEKFGVKRIEALNTSFDPALHEAMGELEREDVEPMTVVEELEKGYLLKDRLLRPAKVIVARRAVQQENRLMKDSEEEAREREDNG